MGIVRTKANTMLLDLVRSVTRTVSGGSIKETANYYWIGLSTTTPAGDGSNFTEPEIPAEGATNEDGVEVTVNEYERVSLEGLMGTPENGIIANSDIIFFNEAESYTWGTIVAFGIFTAKSKDSAPTPLFFGEVKNSDGTVGVEVKKNHIPIFRAGKLQIGLDQNPASPITP